LEDEIDDNFKTLSRIPEEYTLANSQEEIESLILTILHKPNVRQILSVIIGDEISHRISRGDIAIRIDNTSYNKNDILSVSNASIKSISQVQATTDVQHIQPVQLQTQQPLSNEVPDIPTLPTLPTPSTSSTQ